MTYTSNDPSWWPTINFALVLSYSTVASSTVVVYDWALTSGQEFELVWSQRWSLITVLYLSVRCLGVVYCGHVVKASWYCANKRSLMSSASILWNISVSMNDAGCNIILYLTTCTPPIVVVILGVVMIIRLHAMYQGSRQMLIFLVVILLAVTIVTGVVLAIVESYTRREESVLSGTYHCLYYSSGGNPLLIGEAWEFVAELIWEVLALCLTVWIVIKHFRELQQQPAGWTVRGCFMVLIKTRVLYFAAFAVASCFALDALSPSMSNISSVGDEVYNGVYRIIIRIQLFILGPRLIFSVRAQHAQLLASSNEGPAMTTIAFQERTYEPSDSDV